MRNRILPKVSATSQCFMPRVYLQTRSKLGFSAVCDDGLENLQAKQNHVRNLSGLNKDTSSEIEGSTARSQTASADLTLRGERP